MTNSELIEVLENAADFYDHMETSECGEDARYDSFSEMKAELRQLAEDGFSPDVLKRITPYMPFLETQAVTITALWDTCVSAPCISNDLLSNRTRKWKPDLPALPEAKQSQLSDIMLLSEARQEQRKSNKKVTQRYKASLTKVLTFLRSKNLIPANSSDIFCRTTLLHNPLFLNRMLYALGPLYGILNGGMIDGLSKASISDNTWLSAIELVLLMQGITEDEIENLGAPEENDELDAIMSAVWPNIICYGLLIHNLHLFTKDPYLTMLYLNNYEPNRDASERKELRQTNQRLEEEKNALQRRISDQKNQIASLKAQLSRTPQSGKADSALVHQFNLKLKEKDGAIEQLQRRIELLENERAEQEHRAMLDAEAALTTKPWLQEDLPENGILFVGGHTNMVKKLKEIHPSWSYISDYINASLPTKVNAIFIWPAHLSHPLWYRINETYQGREKMLYVQATNLGRLEEEMKYELWKMKNTH